MKAMRLIGLGWTLIVLIVFLSTSLKAQDMNFGIRAGISQNRFLGPSEEGVSEKYSFTGGIHFGINMQYNFTDIIGWRTEVLYTQLGSKYSFDSPNGYYVFKLFNVDRYVLRDTSNISLVNTNSYIQFPQTFHFRVGDKMEVFAGGYLGLLLSPTGRGTWIFGGEGNDEHAFEQGLDYTYNSDLAGQISQYSRLIYIRVTGEDVDLPSLVGANYLLSTTPPTRFNKVDYGLIGGASYFMNRGLYVMFRVEYGLSDITRNSGDFSYQQINPDTSPVFLDHFDRNLGINLSLGFKF